MNTDTYNEPIEYGYVNMPYNMEDMSGYHYNDNNVYEQQHSVVDYNLIDEILQGLEVYHVHINCSHLNIIVAVPLFFWHVTLMLRCISSFLVAR
jgi:hypothetical protein